MAARTVGVEMAARRKRRRRGWWRRSGVRTAAALGSADGGGEAEADVGGNAGADISGKLDPGSLAASASSPRVQNSPKSRSYEPTGDEGKLFIPQGL
jgi:hypothetical protein